MFACSNPAVRFCYLRDAAQLYGANPHHDPVGSTESNKGLAYATPGSVGLDLRACFETNTQTDHAACTSEFVIEPGQRLAVPTGIAVEPLTPGIAGFVYSRSGLGAVQGLTVAQGTGVIDPDYRGEITVFLLNTSSESRRLRRGDRVAQLVFQPALQVTLHNAQSLGTTQRGEGGFGHTGSR